MKPMMFTMVFIIAIFAWMGTAVGDFRVSYVSLPWAPEWNLETGKFLFFPAWIATYICMSAPFGRVVDRHIKLFRYRSHPIVSEGQKLKEPLLHLVSAPKSGEAHKRVTEKRDPSKGEAVQGNHKSLNLRRNHLQKSSAKECPECGSTMIERDGPVLNICKVCRHEWR